MRSLYVLLLEGRKKKKKKKGKQTNEYLPGK